MQNENSKPLTILIPEPDEDGLCDVTCILLRGDYENDFSFSCKYGEIVKKTLCKPSSGCPWYKHEGGKDE